MLKFQPKTYFIGKNAVYLPSCHSTNEIASEIIQNQNFFEGTVVITDNQTAGKGQRGNSWESLAGQNITFSVLLKPLFLHINEQFKLNIAISLAIYEFLCKFLSKELAIKWPNDMYVGNKKIGGILIENSISGNRIAHSIIGIGINVNQQLFQDKKASSLALETNRFDYPIHALIEILCECIEKYYLQLKNGQYSIHKQKYLERLFWIQEIKPFYFQNERKFGKIIDVNTQGKLLIDFDGKIIDFDLKEISFDIPIN